jgi:hypothetical protein
VRNLQSDTADPAGLVAGLTWHVQQDVHRLCKPHV